MHHAAKPVAQMHYVKVDQQANIFPAQLEISNQLCQMNGVNRIYCLDFDDHRILHENVNSESEIDPLAVIVHRKGRLRGSSKATLSQLTHQADLVDALQQSRSQSRMDFHRGIDNGAADLVKMHQVCVLCGSTRNVIGSL